MKISRRTAVISTSAVLVAAALGGAALVVGQPQAPTATPTHRVSPRSTPGPTSPPDPTRTPAYVVPSPAAVAALPEAKYNAVIPGLLGFASADVPAGMKTVDSIAVDAPLYGADRATPVARLAAKNFLGTSTIVVPVRTDGDWTLVLTPARKSLPSTDPKAPAQSAGWIRRDLLTTVQDLTSHIIISVGKQTVSVADSTGKTLKTYPAAVGAASTPTPTGVVGYVQARYLDPAQDQTTYPITLTSLHSAAADEPFGGTDGGLIGVHYFSERTGAISHGCVRVSGDVITALDALPLGTPIVITP